jgi:hypothetical protein
MSMQDITLYLHIGTGKTGTSSIQNFLAGNTRILWDSCSCLYPNMNRNNLLNENFINHQKLFLTTDLKTRKERIQKAIVFCRKHARKKLVFSAEALFENKDGPALAKELLEMPGVDLKIIVYLRRQDQWLESAWKEWGYKSRKYTDISNYIRQRDCDWLRTLKRWEDAVGREPIIVRCYEKEQLPSGLIQDFSFVIGIDYGSFEWIPKKDLFKGFQRDVMEVLFLNKEFCTGGTDIRLQTFFERNLDESFRKESFKSYSFLSPAERIFILKKYEAANRIIAREYLGREDGVLFYEPWPSEDEPWNSYKGLTVERIVPIFTQILFHMDNRNNKKNRHTRDEPADGKPRDHLSKKHGGIRGILAMIKEKCRLRI